MIDPSDVRGDLVVLSRRAKLIGRAITLCTTTALLVCTVIAALFLSDEPGIGHVELQNRRQMSKESTFRVWTLVLLMRNGNFSVERLMDLLIALMPSNPKAPWYFELIMKT